MLFCGLLFCVYVELHNGLRKVSVQDSFSSVDTPTFGLFSMKLANQLVYSLCSDNVSSKIK